MNDEQQIIEPVPTMAGYKKIPTFKLWIANQFPYIETDFDAITNYELLQAVIKYLNTIIENENNVESNVTALYNAFVNLHDYVKEQFDSLNLQDEVNAKIDEMYESGLFDNLLNNYLNLTKVFDTYIDMMLDTSTYVNGMKLKTLGYHYINDGGGAEYVVTNVQNNNKYQVSIGTNLWIEMIDTDTIYVEQFGAYGDKTNDDSAAVQNAINYGASTHKNIVMNKNYLINTPITISNKDGFKLIGNLQMFGHVENNLIEAPNGFLKITDVMKMYIQNLSVNAVNSTCIEFISGSNRWINIDNCQFNSTDIGIDAKSLYYSSINNSRFNACRRAMSFGNNGSGAGDITISKCHIPNLTTAFYVDTNSQIRIESCCVENVATILYQAKGSTSFIACYLGDGFRQGFIIVNGSLYLTNIPGELISTKSSQRPSEFGEDRCVLDLQNESQAFLTSVTFNEYYSDAPEIKLSNSAIMFLENVKFKGYQLLQTQQTNILASRQTNYITGKTLNGSDAAASGNTRPFAVTEELVGTNYMGDPVYKYTNNDSTSMGISFQYKVPKAGYYLLWLKLNGPANDDYDYITFKSGCYVPNSEQMAGTKYKKTVNGNFSVNPGSENTIRPALKTYPNSVMVAPIYIDSAHLENSFLYYSIKYYADEEKTIDYIGLTDFENPFCLPCFK